MQNVQKVPRVFPFIAFPIKQAYFIGVFQIQQGFTGSRLQYVQILGGFGEFLIYSDSQEGSQSSKDESHGAPRDLQVKSLPRGKTIAASIIF